MKSAKSLYIRLCILLLALVAMDSWAQPVDADLLRMQKESARFDELFDEKPWSEVEVQIPAYPEQGDLIPFKVGYITDTLFFVDGKSISVGTDGVVRYTLVVVSSQGAQNISYEGMRCSTSERRFYASGRPDKTWSKARNNKWITVRGTTNDYRVELFLNNFCVGGIAVFTAEAARDNLRRGGVVRYR